MNWIETYHLQIAAVTAVVILLTVGRAKILPGIKGMPGGKAGAALSGRLGGTPGAAVGVVPTGRKGRGVAGFLLWLAFLVTAVCGLVLGWALSGVMSWLTGLPGLFGGVVGSVGAVIGMAAGWWSVKGLVALIRDLADATPDDEARTAALWVPTLMPAGYAAVLGVVSNPRGLGSTITAAIMAVITIAACHSIVGAALKGSAGRKAWRWFAAVVCVLAGVVMIPLTAFLDAQAAAWLPGWAMVFGRIILGVLGLALLIAAFIDLKDKVPDAAVRAFAAWGVPLLFLFGSLAAASISGGAENGLQLLTGSVR